MMTQLENQFSDACNMFMQFHKDYEPTFTDEASNREWKDLVQQIRFALAEFEKQKSDYERWCSDEEKIVIRR